MDFKFWGAAPGGFFENPMIFGVFGLVFPSSGVRLVRWPLPLGPDFFSRASVFFPSGTCLHVFSNSNAILALILRVAH